MQREASCKAAEQRVAIIILNFNKKADVLACLESVSQWDSTRNDIVVVDNGSTDGTAAAVQVIVLPR